jgi:endonuclease/exonuclease/phosphatase family metal-dependent hydrolase
MGGSLHFRSFSITFYEDEPGKNKLKVTSYNVRLFDIYNPNFESALSRRNQIFEFLRKNDADIICLQEYYRQEKPTKFETLDSLFSIVGNSKFYHERTAFNRHANQNFGIAMFSKYEIIAKGDVRFHTQGKDDFNYCIYADIVKEKDTFRIYNVHLQSIRLSNAYDGDAKLAEQIDEKKTMFGVYNKLKVAFLDRADQARTVIEHVNSSPYSTIVCGDFNDTPMSYTYNIFNRKLIDAFRNTSSGIGSTYIGKIPAGRIDYIFHSADLKSNKFEIQQEELSDHRAISCIISK